jgi:hypothetical protein
MFNDIKESLFHLGALVAVERPVRKAPLPVLSDRLLTSGNKIVARLSATCDTTENRRLLGHVTGIERWGQRRLRVALGEVFIYDEYDGYRPPQEESWENLIAEFKTTRQETLRLVDEIEKAAAAESLTIDHNQFGPLSVRGWLHYLDMHASGEIQKMR